MAQIAFQWPVSVNYAASDFIISGSNAEAARFLDSWPEDSARIALLSGPEASGKTHLALRWKDRTGASLIDQALLGTLASAELWNGHTHAILEDIHNIIDETAFFHLLRHAESHNLCLLLTSRMHVPLLPFTLPDLRSRLLALPAPHIDAPDEMALHGFLMKYCADHQLQVHEDVIAYLMRRMERSFTVGQALMDKISRNSIETKREITIPFIKPLIENM